MGPVDGGRPLCPPPCATPGVAPEEGVETTRGTPTLTPKLHYSLFGFLCGDLYGVTISPTIISNEFDAQKKTLKFTPSGNICVKTYICC